MNACPLLDRDLRVAVALEDQVALQRAVVERAAEVGLGLPAVVGAEELERGEGRDELHHRRGVHAAVRPVGEQRLLLPDLLDDDADRRQRHAGGDERARDRRWQHRARDGADEREGERECPGDADPGGRAAWPGHPRCPPRPSRAARAPGPGCKRRCHATAGHRRRRGDVRATRGRGGGRRQPDWVSEGCRRPPPRPAPATFQAGCGEEWSHARSTMSSVRSTSSANSSSVTTYGGMK